MPVRNVAVIGGGSFGTVIANISAHNGHHTEVKPEINPRNREKRHSLLLEIVDRVDE